MRVRFTPEALTAIRHKHAWWVQNRDKAPFLFRDELATVIADLRAGATEGAQLYTVHGRRKIWRMLMPTTKAHVYYRLDTTKQEVEIVTMWNPISGEEPDLSFPPSGGGAGRRGGE